MELRKTERFAEWLNGLKDIVGRAKILARIERLSLGNPGDVKPVGKGVSEMRIPYGPGYRIYFKKFGGALIFLLAGGVKSSQRNDIRTALKIAEELKNLP